jgi:hypothetical protein
MSRATRWIAAAMFSSLGLVPASAALAAAERFVVGDRVLELSGGALSESRIRVLAIVADREAVVRDIALGDLPITKDDCEGRCDEGDTPGTCVGVCIRSSPGVLALDQPRGRAFIYVLTDRGGSSTHVLFQIDLREGAISRLESAQATVLSDGSVSPDGRFLTFVQTWRGGPSRQLRLIDLSTHQGFDGDTLFGVDDQTYVRVTRASCLWSGLLRIHAEIGPVDREADPQSGLGEVRQVVRIDYDARKGRVVSRVARPPTPPDAVGR